METQTVYLVASDDAEIRPICALFDQKLRFYLPCDEVTYCFQRTKRIDAAQSVLVFFNSADKAQWEFAAKQFEKLEEFEGTKILVDMRQKHQQRAIKLATIEQSADLRQFICTELPENSKKALIQVLLLCIVSKDNLLGFPYCQLFSVLGFFVIVVAGVFSYVRSKIGGPRL